MTDKMSKIPPRYAPMPTPEVPVPAPTSLKLQVLRTEPDAILPKKALGFAACWDLYSCIPALDQKISYLTISAQNTKKIPTGIAVRPPKGYFTQICSRSGLCVGIPPIFVANAPAIIDPDYTGEIFVPLFNGGFTSTRIHHNQRIAQLLLLPLPSAELVEVHSLPKTERGDRGFGSTGME